MKLNFNQILLTATFSVTLLTELSLYIAEAISLPFFISASLVVFLLFLCDLKEIKINFPSFSLPLIAIAFVLTELYLSFYLDKQLLDAFVEIIIALQIAKWINEKESKDFIQIYTLGFIQLILSSFFSASLPFAIIFFTFVIIITFSLLILTFRKEVEKNYLETDIKKTVRSISIITKPHITLLFAVTLIVFIVTFIIFFSFPRVGTGFLAGKYGLKKVSGFSDSIVFGDIGTIIENDATAMRITASETLKKKWGNAPFYIKGGTLDTFDGKNWTLSESGKEKVGYYGEIYFEKLKSNKNLDIAVVTVEPSDYPVVFKTYDTVKIKGLRGAIYLDYEENLFSPSTFQKKSSYEIYINSGNSSFSKNPIPAKRHFSTHKSWNDFKPILEGIVISSQNNEEKAKKIEQYFKENFTYTLNSPSNKAENPIKDFLMNSKKGHCEYFASAMVAFLRELNIPARIATGYKGGEWNEFGNYFAVQQKNAHSWVEAYIDGKGWLMFDPTPSDLTLTAAQSSSYSKLLRYIDYIKAKWDRYVIDYSAKDQTEIISKLKKERIKLNAKAFSALSFVRNNSFKFLTFTVLLVLSVWIIFTITKKLQIKDTKPFLSKNSKLMLSALRLIEKKFYLKKEEVETFEEFNEKIRLKDQFLGEMLSNTIILYQKIRFGGYELSEAFLRKITDMKNYLKKIKS